MFEGFSLLSLNKYSRLPYACMQYCIYCTLHSTVHRAKALNPAAGQEQKCAKTKQGRERERKLFVNPRKRFQYGNEQREIVREKKGKEGEIGWSGRFRQFDESQPSNQGHKASGRRRSTSEAITPFTTSNSHTYNFPPLSLLFFQAPRLWIWKQISFLSKSPSGESPLEKDFTPEIQCNL